MKFNRTFFAGITLMVVMLVSLNVQAGDPARKLGRGISNLGLGALEIPMKVYDVNQEEGGVAALTYGVFLGLGYTIAREFVGLTEVVTFLVPLPGCTDDPHESGWGYGPIMYPEWVVDQDHDIYNVIYQDLPVN